MYARAPHMHLVPLEVRREQWIPGTDVTEGCELPYKYQVWSLCLLEEQPMLLTAEPHLWTLCGSEISGYIPGPSQARGEHWFPGFSQGREHRPLFPAMPGESADPSSQPCQGRALAPVPAYARRELCCRLVFSPAGKQHLSRLQGGCRNPSSKGILATSENYELGRYRLVPKRIPLELCVCVCVRHGKCREPP